jgi:hypothetical protein
MQQSGREPLLACMEGAEQIDWTPLERIQKLSSVVHFGRESSEIDKC